MFPQLYMVYAFIIALGSGVFGALLGLGGGVLLVPLLVFLLGVPIHLASGASIIAVVATSSAATATYVKEGLTNIRLGMFLELATTIGAVSGAFLASLTSEWVLRVVFGISLLYATATMFLQQRRGERSRIRRRNDQLSEMLQLGGGYFDAALGVDVTYGVGRTPLTFAVSYLAGIVSGLLGIGGGGVKVPAMNLLSGVPMKAAVATSNFMVGVTAAASALVYMRNQCVDAFIAAPVVLGALIGAYAGARLTNRVRGAALKNLFIVVLTILAVRMILSGLGV